MIFRSEDKFSLVIFQVKYLGKAWHMGPFRTAAFLAECDSPAANVKKKCTDESRVVRAVHVPLGFWLTRVVWPLPGDSCWAAVLSSVKWDGKPIQSWDSSPARHMGVSSEVFLPSFLSDLQAPYTLRLARCPLQRFLSPQLWTHSLRARTRNVYRRVTRVRMN